MQLPRRVPWASIAELDQVCAWIYADQTDYSAKELAVHRLSAWRVITPLPHALESTLAFLAVILQDNTTVSSSTSYSLRQSYATALIRFVNGLVDPLQSGPYARSIASIAAQLGLPGWLVELRHAATHEDLPSLEVLREATCESLGWLLHNYFLPVLNPSSVDQSRGQPVQPVSPLLKKYKALSKVVTRDASLKSKYQAEITRVLRSIERWVSEAKVAANVGGGAFGWDIENTEDGDGLSRLNTKEKLALEGLCDGLLAKGCLVPLSKRKRTLAKDSFTLPKSLLSLWTPLLLNVQNLHPAFPSILVSRILSRLVSDPSVQQNGSTQARDSSYEMCLAAWVIFLLQTCGTDDDTDTGYDILNTRRIIVSLMTDLGPVEGGAAADCKAAKFLLKELCKDSPELADTYSLITNTRFQSPIWQEDDLFVMNARLNELLIKAKKLQDNAELDTTPITMISTSTVPALPAGWRCVDAGSGWRPSPIGVFVPCK